MFKLLIVDDEPMICEGLAAYAQRFWKNSLEWVHTAPDGETAWKSIQENAPDLLITDIRMPHGSGIELLERIRGQELDIKAIVLSGYSDFEYVRDMARLGIENYLLKPVNEEELVSTVNNTLQKIEKEHGMRMQARLNEDLIRENIINRWLYGAIGENELVDRAEFLGLDLEAEEYLPCCIRLLGTEEERGTQLLFQIYTICRELLKAEECYFSRNYNGDVIAVFCAPRGEAPGRAASALNRCLDQIRAQTGQKAYVLLGNSVPDYWKVSESFRNAIANGVHIDRIRTAEEKEDEDGNASPFSLRLAQYVLEHYREELSLKSLAQHFHGNAAYIGQVFRRDMHKSFSDYLRDVRLEKAKELLVSGNASAKEIGERVGFSNTTYFSTVFKKETGLSPDRYRKEFGKKNGKWRG